jgi:hypothetical protein
MLTRCSSGPLLESEALSGSFNLGLVVREADAGTWFGNVSLDPGFDRTVGDEAASRNFSIHERESAFA